MMSVFKEREERLKAVANQRLASLLGDGFLLSHIADLGENNKTIVKLRHRTNGNIVVMIVDYHNRRLSQSTNGKIVHYESF